MNSEKNSPVLVMKGAGYVAKTPAVAFVENPGTVRALEAPSKTSMADYVGLVVSFDVLGCRGCGGRAHSVISVDYGCSKECAQELARYIDGKHSPWMLSIDTHCKRNGWIQMTTRFSGNVAAPKHEPNAGDMFR